MFLKSNNVPAVEPYQKRRHKEEEEEEEEEMVDTVHLLFGLPLPDR